jgi:CHAD domain-containing protein
MAAAVTFAREFGEQWTGWQHAVDACRADAGRHRVHELRVRSRRLGALLALAKRVADWPRKSGNRVADAVEGVMDALSPLRDVQNQERRLGQRRDDEGLERIRQRLKKREAKLTRRAAVALDQAKSRRVRKAADRLHTALEAGHGGPRRPERDLRLVKAVDVTAADVRNRLARLDVTSTRSAHRLRVALKHFRDTVDVAIRLSPVVRVTGRATVRVLQRRLGDAHDADVLLERLAREARRHPRDAGTALDALRAAVTEDRDRHLHALPKSLASLRRSLTGVAEQATRPARPDRERA